MSVTDQLQKWHKPPNNINDLELNCSWDELKAFEKPPEMSDGTYSTYEMDRLINIHINRKLFTDITRCRNVNAQGLLNDHNYYDNFEESFISHVNNITQEKILAIEKSTILQNKSKLWKNVRKSRITASVAGEVVKFMKSGRSCAKSICRKILSPPNLDHIPAIKNGIKGEKIAFEEYRQTLGFPIRKCGIFVDVVRNFLAASPDGICESKDFIIEIKCPFTETNVNKLAYLNRGKLVKSHNYYTQIQIQLHVTKMKMCHFIVYSVKAGFLHIETIFYDSDFVEQILTYIDKFYKDIFIREYIIHNFSEI